MFTLFYSIVCRLSGYHCAEEATNRKRALDLEAEVLDAADLAKTAAANGDEATAISLSSQVVALVKKAIDLLSSLESVLDPSRLEAVRGEFDRRANDEMKAQAADDHADCCADARGNAVKFLDFLEMRERWGELPADRLIAAASQLMLKLVHHGEIELAIRLYDLAEWWLDCATVDQLELPPVAEDDQQEGLTGKLSGLSGNLLKFSSGVLLGEQTVTTASYTIKALVIAHAQRRKLLKGQRGKAERAEYLQYADLSNRLPDVMRTTRPFASGVVMRVFKLLFACREVGLYYIAISLYVLNVNRQLFGFGVDNWIEPPKLFAPGTWDISAESWDAFSSDRDSQLYGALSLFVMVIFVVASCWSDDKATEDRLDADARARGKLVQKAHKTGVKRLSDPRFLRYFLNITQTRLLWEFGWSCSSLYKGRTDLSGYQQCFVYNGLYLTLPHLFILMFQVMCKVSRVWGDAFQFEHACLPGGDGAIDLAVQCCNPGRCCDEGLVCVGIDSSSSGYDIGAGTYLFPFDSLVFSFASTASAVAMLGDTATLKWKASFLAFIAAQLLLRAVSVCGMFVVLVSDSGGIAPTTASNATLALFAKAGPSDVSFVPGSARLSTNLGVGTLFSVADMAGVSQNRTTPSILDDVSYESGGYDLLIAYIALGFGTSLFFNSRYLQGLSQHTAPVMSVLNVFVAIDVSEYSLLSGAVPRPPRLPFFLFRMCDMSLCLVLFMRHLDQNVLPDAFKYAMLGLLMLCPICYCVCLLVPHSDTEVGTCTA